MDEDRIEGTARDLSGKMNEAAGQAQDAYGRTVDEVKEFTQAQPFMALLFAMGVGILIGFALARS
jgi:ElaB/YqjD/DUF883 family membrane-anchored ribosome-binding protein